MLYRFLQILGWPLAWALWLRKVKGRSNLPTKGGFIIAANHSSYLDFLLLSIACPRPIAYLATEAHFRKPAWRRFMKLCGHIEMDRQQSVHLGTMKDALKCLRSGHVLGIFPEGTRSHDGRIRQFSTGVGWLASRSNSPIIPAVLRRTQDIYPRNQRFPRLRRIAEVEFGAPLLPSGFDNKKDLVADLYSNLTQLMAGTQKESIENQL